MKARKLIEKALNAPQNLRFVELCNLAELFGYRLDRISGSHHIFVNPRAGRPLNLQNFAGKAKPYQVRQLLRDVEEFHLQIEE